VTDDLSVYHIATPVAVDELRATGQLEPPSLEAEGFVHCSTASQVVATTARYFAPDADLLLVELFLGRVDDRLQWPEVYPGQRFPHLHGPVLLDDVVAIHPWGPDDRDHWSI
jgi:uncharacterized protein (DUF952 family)